MTRALDDFEAQRPRLFALSYRMLGTLNDVDDVLQEAWLKWSKLDRDSIQNAPAFLTTIVTRLCIDQLRKGKRRREEYIGPWLPEPLVTSESHFEPGSLADSLTTAFLLMLERLSAKERAVFLLREAFDLDYKDIADIIQGTESQCRQLFHRGKERLQSPRKRFRSSPEKGMKILESFIQTCMVGDLEDLKRVLAEDVVSWADSDGKGLAARNLIRGREKVARMFQGILRKIPEGFRSEPRLINGSPGLISWQDEKLHSALWLDIEGELIHNLYFTVNPDKLRGLIEESEGQ